ncbi:hypothetical protein BS50DRAFT_574557 [Corynespora cassiicola Philippines]|uniref:Uncharacterized protein n=1 Tax=Corynespora cassiicola Philippines TaxID=1448308 RepID=A0A2T2NKZ7_CORCC|nr:hypothetical protein BS50DRAFT_574557 [Corynespora cassiicola Philippines]
MVDAVSLAFLSHQVSSQTARDLGMRKYGTALKKFTRTMQDPNNFCKPSTLESVLLFDLFENIMKPDAGLDYSNTHVQGALALVKLRGIEQFNEPKEVKALMGLALSATINSLCSGDPIPEAVRDIRKHAAQFVDTSYPKWKLSGVILDVTDTPAEMLFSESRCSSHPTKSIELDKKLEEIALEAGPAWTYERNFISGHDPRRMVPDDFFPVYDIYPNRTITQMYNVLRLSRILLCEQIIDDLPSMDDECAGPLIERAKLTITAMIREILASVPQMTNCNLAAKHKLPNDSLPDRHTHTMSHILDVYVLIYPLYIVAWSQNCPPTAREWTMSQLRHISEHFGIKEASSVIDILRKRDNQGEIIDACIDMAESVPESSTVGVTSHPFGKQTDIGNPCSKPCGKTRADPWVVYRLLGSYAFAAT